ncbi:bifunctional adenosylcobinamide kinase/adenosylcobinamide-phosphate guanylyltransferase [Prosthecochloris sp. GSB1]|uniref:bifunctional adenosylcobinamide kinase/adenosylcobinamide-phosphate guanylyltransferase n=1 Tax=Prosthecochloris sp. GSB1 TaxID=281093 RepID=UPI000B8CE95A|nr:bifunctional adenosylcobinamide kinase/adenosylcobinamide-phosphate guanylyltransferase [Prosthecochloris sp. GSB1]ASQ90404.1 bifunctional adenosylcobinamide kinase/adenosylcobinamide-phosphate guanylyltransferase [Prosthecochloris sp. GSB1]
MKDIVFLTGGARSGKSSFALERASGYRRKAFLATAEAFDEEMERRIRHHRQERGEEFVTIEEPLHIDVALRKLTSEHVDVVVLDCLTVWIANLMHHAGSEEGVRDGMERFLDVFADPPVNIIAVSNEVGMGIVPENAMARTFRDLAGSLNQKTAAVSTEAWMLCSGIPLRLK